MVLLCFVMGRVVVLTLCDLVLRAGPCCVVIKVLLVVVRSWSIVTTIPGPQSRAWYYTCMLGTVKLRYYGKIVNLVVVHLVLEFDSGTLFRIMF
jgi:hypothetical protein